MTAQEVIHPSRGRVYVRRFDHEEAARRIANGEKASALAAEYGVTSKAIHLAVAARDPERREATNEYHRRWRTTVCEDCGGPAMKLVGGKREKNRDGRILCNTCRGKEKREGVEVDADGRVLRVRCVTCKAWQEPGVFCRGVRYRDLRDGGFHNECRPCGTARRIRYRDEHRVPCESCGTPVEGKGRPNTKSAKAGRRAVDPDRAFLCIACWHESPEGQAAMLAAVEASALARKKK